MALAPPPGKSTSPTFAEVIERVATARDLPDHRKRQWICALRRIAAGAGRPLEAMPGQWSLVRGTIEGLHHTHLACNTRTLANYRSGVQAALRWYSQETGVPKHGAPLPAEWLVLVKPIRQKTAWKRLSSLIRYCAAQGIAPAAVDDAVLVACLDYRARATALPFGKGERRQIARAWNACVAAVPGWPARQLSVPRDGRQKGEDWSAFPLGLQSDIEAYLSGLAKPHRTADGKRMRPAAATTIRTRRAELVSFARQAVRRGTPIESLTSLAALLDPVVVRSVLDARWRADGVTPKTYTVDLAVRLHARARDAGCLDEPDLPELAELREDLELQRRGGLTDKNRAVIREVLTTEVWGEVVRLPLALMREAPTAQAP